MVIEKILNGHIAFWKFLSVNDSGENGSHQAGILLSNKIGDSFFGIKKDGDIRKKSIQIKWQNNFSLIQHVLWYPSKQELRLTKFGKQFAYRGPKYTGALFVLLLEEKGKNYEAFVFSTDKEINYFCNILCLSLAESNSVIDVNDFGLSPNEMTYVEDFIKPYPSNDFPSCKDMALKAREICNKVDKNNPKKDVDAQLLRYIDFEYKMFRKIEATRYASEYLQDKSLNIQKLVFIAKKILNRRKSRAGKSLEHHLAAIFDDKHLRYESQVVTEGNKRPDFIFPSSEAYHNIDFPINRLISLAAKTTCKDRWRQVLNEADRLKNDYKYLCTLQQGISSQQMDEMKAEKVILVVPRPYIASYPKEKRDCIWTIGKFVNYIKEVEI